MRLASKIFLACSLVIVVVAAVGVLSLRAVGRLVSVNREITTQTVPALLLSASLHDELLSLTRIEARWAVLRDQRYERLWVEAAERADADLVRLGELLRTEREARLLAETQRLFALYRAAVAEERIAASVPAADSSSRALADRVELALDALTEATHARVVAGQAEAIRLESRTWTGVVVALVAASGLALVSTGLIALRMTRSLRDLSAATTAVAAGSFRDPIPAGARDEIGALAHSFNAMAAQLQRLDDTKAEFFARLSHELRSPLTSVREAAQLLREQVPGELNAKQARLVDIVSLSTDRLLRLVNQMLEMSRLRAGVLPLERRRFDLERVVTRGLEEMRPQAVEAGVDLERERVGADFTYQGDEDIFRALEAGAVTYLLKDMVADKMMGVIREVAGGGRPMLPEVAQRLSERMFQAALTAREVEVLQLVARGLRNKEIAANLYISDETVQGHVKSILAKLSVHDRTEAVAVAVRRGIVHLE